MACMPTITVPLLLCCFFMASAHAECSRNEESAFDDIACASNALDEANRDLNEVYKQLLETLDTDAKSKVRSAQRFWLKYRDAHASFVLGVEGDGSLGRLIVTNDQERQTHERVKELSNWLPRR